MKKNLLMVLALGLATLNLPVTASAAETRTATPAELAALTKNPYFAAVINTVQTHEKSLVEVQEQDVPADKATSAKCQTPEGRLMTVATPYAHAPTYHTFTYSAVCEMKAREYKQVEITGTIRNGEVNVKSVQLGYDYAG